jgi:oligopeptide transport system ATP-binding protein
MTTPLLQVRSLRVRYRGGSSPAMDAVAGVSFELAAGESVGLVGESGSGKSSIARALLRLVPATGSVLFQQGELLELQGEALRAAREHMQIVFQDPIGALDPRMTVAQICAEPLREFRAEQRARHPEMAVAMLARVGLGPELMSRYPHELSGGQAQRVGLARALMLNPRLLICDEPVAALDVSIRAQIANLLRDMRAELGLTLLFIAHDLPTVRFLCDRVLVLFRGQHRRAGAARRAVQFAATSLYASAAGCQSGPGSGATSRRRGTNPNRSRRWPGRGLRLSPSLPAGHRSLRKGSAAAAPGG